jgi:hypothetical protein
MDSVFSMRLRYPTEGMQEKDDPADIAQAGFNAMMRGDGDVVRGGRTSCK